MTPTKTLQNAPGRIGTSSDTCAGLFARLQRCCSAALGRPARRETPILANHRMPADEALANAGMPFTVLQDNWVQIPLGDFPHPGPQLPNGKPVYRDGVIQRVDAEAVESLVNSFNSIKGKLGRLFGGVPWFKGHPDMDPDQYPDKDAYGWIEAMENHGDQGLFLKVKWTDAGEQLKSSGAYKFYSPTWGYKDAGLDNGKPVLKPTKLFSVGFVNNPNIPVMPLANSSADFIPGAETALLEEVRALRGELAEAKEALANYGTSEGARKGWETRRGNMAASKASAKVAARAKKAASAPAKAAAKTKIATKLDKDGRPMPVAPESVSLMQHPTYKKAIAEGASHETALAEAKGDVDNDREMARMQRNAAAATAKLRAKPVNPAAAVAARATPPPLPKPSFAARAAQAASKLFRRS